MIVYAVLCVAWFFVGTYHYGVWLAKKDNLTREEWITYYDTIIDTKESLFLAPFYRMFGIDKHRVDEDLSIIAYSFFGFMLVWFVLVLATALLVSYPLATLSLFAVIGGGIGVFVYGLSKGK